MMPVPPVGRIVIFCPAVKDGGLRFPALVLSGTGDAVDLRVFLPGLRTEIRQAVSTMPTVPGGEYWCRPPEDSPATEERNR